MNSIHIAIILVGLISTLLFHQHLAEILQEYNGLINHISNIVVPQVSGDDNEEDSTRKIIKTTRQL